MTTDYKVIELFCIIDEFCKHFEAENAGKQLPGDNENGKVAETGDSYTVKPDKRIKSQVPIESLFQCGVAILLVCNMLSRLPRLSNHVYLQLYHTECHVRFHKVWLTTVPGFHQNDKSYRFPNHLSEKLER